MKKTEARPEEEHKAELTPAEPQADRDLARQYTEQEKHRVAGGPEEQVGTGRGDDREDLTEHDQYQCTSRWSLAHGLDSATSSGGKSTAFRNFLELTERHNPRPPNFSGWL